MIRFRGIREAQDGARWDGMAEVVGGRVVETGVWVMEGGARVAGTLEMVLGEGVLRVVTAFGEHKYVLQDVAGGFEGAYRCGEDDYRVWSEAWGENGWKMRFEVRGPRKDGWQTVRYERQLAELKEGF